MAEINQEAFEDLEVSLGVLIPEINDPDIELIWNVHPRKFLTAGIGGFVGIGSEANSELFGCRIDAQILVFIEAGGRSELNQAASIVMKSLLGAKRKDTVELGIQKIWLKENGNVAEKGSGNNLTVSQTLTFEILYEYVVHPDASDEVIETISQNIQIGSL